MCTQTICQKIQLTLVIKDEDLTGCFAVSSHVQTLKHKVTPAYNLETAVSAASGNKQTAVSKSYAVV